jgi:hypothetical protein
MKNGEGMTDLGNRFLKDLRVDYRKTAVMLLLAMVFIVVLIYSFSQDSNGPELGRIPPSASASNTSTSTVAGIGGNENSDPRMRASVYPRHLTEALPLEALQRNPFKPFFKIDLPDEGEKPPPPDHPDPGKEAESEEQRLDSISVTCTVTGPGSSYAIVDGQILRVGDRHKGFEVQEIGDRSVYFKGKSLSRRIQIDF